MEDFVPPFDERRLEETLLFVVMHEPDIEKLEEFVDDSKALMKLFRENYISVDNRTKDKKVKITKDGDNKLKVLQGEVENIYILDRLKAETEKVEFIPPKTKDDHGTYIIYMKNERIEITTDKMQTVTKFCAMYNDRFGEFIKVSNKDHDSDWAQLVSYWGSMREVLENRDVGTEDMVVDEILLKLGDCKITTDIGKASRIPDYLFYDEQRDSLLYASRNVKRILKQARLGINMNILNKFLKPYLNDDSIKKKVGKVGERFWVFNIESIGFSRDDINEALEIEKEEENDEKE